MPMVMFNEEERLYCADCLWKLQKGYKEKRNCTECGFFDVKLCKKNNMAILHVNDGFHDFYPLAEKCQDFT